MENVSITITASTVAWYAAVMATASAFVSFYNILRDRAKIIISHQKGMKMINPAPGFSAEKNYVIVTVRNKGRRPISLGNAAFATINGEALIITDSFMNTSGDNRILTEENPEGKFIVDPEGIDFSEILYIQVFDKAGREYRKYMCKLPTFRKFLYKFRKQPKN